MADPYDVNVYSEGRVTLTNVCDALSATPLQLKVVTP